MRRICLHFGRLLADTFVLRSTYWVSFFCRCPSSMLSWEEPCGFRPLLNWRKKWGTKIKMIAITSSVFDIKFFICSFGRAFKVMKNGVYYILVCLVIQYFGLYKSDDLWRHIVDTQSLFKVLKKICSLRETQFSNLTLETQALKLDTWFSKSSRMEIRVLGWDCQLTFDRYCEWPDCKSKEYLVCNLSDYFFQQSKLQETEI